MLLSLLIVANAAGDLLGNFEVSCQIWLLLLLIS